MSADNGIYILRTPARPVRTGNSYVNQHDVYEYRVAECQAIENIDYHDLYANAYFGDCVPTYSEDEALKTAHRLLKEISDSGGICEYGVAIMRKDFPFPNLSCEAALEALNSFVKPEDAFNQNEV